MLALKLGLTTLKILPVGNSPVKYRFNPRSVLDLVCLLQQVFGF